MCREAGLGVILLALSVAAHEHHEDNIPDGEAVSAEPIVPFTLSKDKLAVKSDASSLGFHSMGAHHNPAGFVRSHLPHWHGSWGLFSRTYLR